MGRAYWPRGSAVCLLLLVFSACTQAPQRDPLDAGDAVPDRWSGREQVSKPVPERWLEGFGQPALTRAVQEALGRNYDLRAAAARVEAARQLARIEGSTLWPQLGFTGGYQRSQVRDSGFGSSEFGAFQALFTLDWELDVWGRIRAARDAAGQDAEAAASDFRSARLSLAARTAQAWFDLAEARAQVQVSEQSIHDRRVIVDLVRGRFARGLTRGLDLRLALTDLADAEAQLAEARNREQIAGRLLETLLGHYPGNSRPAVLDLPEPPAQIQAGLPSELLLRRPDLAAAFQRLKAQDLRLESAEKALLPRIALTADGGTRSAALAELIDPRAAAWNLGMGLLQPIFTGGRLNGEIDLASARADEALNLYRSSALDAFRQVEQALGAEEWLRRQEQALREAVEQTEASRKLAVYAYRHGDIEILTLLDSYRSTLSAQSAHLAVRRQLLNNRVGLYLALGGGV